MLVSNGNSFITKSFFAFVNRSLLWCFISHLEDVLGYEHCLQKYLFYHFFISRLLSTPVPALKYLFVRNQALRHLASLHPECEMKHRLPPRQDALGRESSCPLTTASAVAPYRAAPKHVRKTSGKTTQHFQSLSVLASECYGVIFKIFLLTAVQPERQLLVLSVVS